MMLNRRDCTKSVVGGNIYFTRIDKTSIQKCSGMEKELYFSKTKGEGLAIRGDKFANSFILLIHKINKGHEAQTW